MTTPVASQSILDHVSDEVSPGYQPAHALTGLRKRGRVTDDFVTDDDSVSASMHTKE